MRPGARAHDDEKAELLRLFGDWHDPVPAVLAAARPEDVLRHDVHHVAEPLPAYHRGRVALVGDAAHAMPPTPGQGGNQAIEDAIVLAHLQAPGGAEAAAEAVTTGLAAYTAARLPRTTATARKTVKVARLNMMGGRVATAVRDAMVAAVSKAAPTFVLRGYDGIADRRPPASPYASGQTPAGKQ